MEEIEKNGAKKAFVRLVSEKWHTLFPGLVRLCLKLQELGIIYSHGKIVHVNGEEEEQ